MVELAQEGAADLYGADLLLIRPDQIIAWRGSANSVDAHDLLWELTGHVADVPRTVSADMDAAE